MDTPPDPWARRLPRLFARSYVDYADAHITYESGAAPPPLVSRLHLVAVTERAEVVVCRSAEGWRFLPGGTREPRESLAELARRELLEEAGATLDGDLVHFGAHRADNRRGAPYRSHFPHPRAYWAYATCRVRITGAPTNPPDGETVVDVLTLHPDAAAEYLEADDPIQADVVRHAQGLGLLSAIE